MANLDRIVNVAISLSTTAIKEQNFSDLLVLAPHSLAVNRVLVVTEAGELLDLGLDPADPLYIAVRDAFKQIPTVQRVYVGRQQVDTIAFSVARASDSEYSVTLKWRDAAGNVQTIKPVYVGLDDSTPESIATGLASAITASDAPVSAVATNANVAVTLGSAGQAVALTLGSNLLASASVPTETVTAALNACKRESDDWYGLTVASNDAAVLLEAAEWAESNKKLHGVSIDQAGIIDAAITADIASVTQQRQYFRTHVWYHGQARRESLAAAISANRFTFYPGGETWANARLAGISYDALSEGQALAAQAKNANTFEQMRNFAVTQNGKVASGEWIDVIRGRDWLEEQVKINVASALVNANGKVPYTDDGIQVIATAIRQALQLGVTRGLIAPDELDEAGNVIPGFTVTVPRAAAISANDKANRILRDLKFSARLAGAIHVAEIKGNLTYQNA